MRPPTAIACLAALTLGLACAATWAQTTATARAEEGPALKPAEPSTGHEPASQPTTAKTQTEPPPSGSRGLFDGNMWFLLVMVGAIVLMMVLSGRSRRKQEAKKQAMLGSLKKGDRVTTIGGIVGIVIEVRPHDVVVKVDEQNNVRMRFLRSAIHHVGELPGDQKELKEPGRS